MSNHPSAVLILAEDQEQQNLVWHYLKNCSQYRKIMGRVRKLPLPASRGCGSQYVREQFPLQVAACREQQARNLLIVITDADNLTPLDREKTLHDELDRASYVAITAQDPIVVFVPKWQVETWIKCLLGQNVREDDRDSDRPSVCREEIVAASKELFAWARPHAAIGVTCVDSLRSALPRWLRIG